MKRLLKPASQLVIDALIAAIALTLAFALRYDGDIPQRFVDILPALTAGVVVGKTIISLLLGNYRRMWKYTSLHEAAMLGVTAVLAALALVVLRQADLLRLPYSVIVIDAAVYFLGVVGVRMLRRYQVQYIVKRRSQAVPAQEEVRTLFIGAGDAAHVLLHELDITQSYPWAVLGLLDDDPDRQGRLLHGRPVMGPLSQLERTIQQLRIQHVVIALPETDEARLQNLIDRAQETGVSVQVIPSLTRVFANGHANGHADGHGRPQGDGHAHAEPTLEPTAESTVEPSNLRNRTARSQTVVRLADLVDAKEIRNTPRLVFDRGAQRERTILITGGAGYIGSHLTRKLLEQDYKVRLLDNFTFGDRGIAPLRGHPNLEIVRGDISSIRDVTSSVKDVGTVIALAAIVGDPACGLNAEETLNLNFESTKVLAEACDFYGIDRLVFASSCSVYGSSDSELLDETSPLNPVSLYARTRIMSEDILRERCGNVTPVILRLATVFGLSPRMRFDLVVNTLTVRGVVDGKFQVFGGEQWRPFVHCKDVARAFALAATAPKDIVGGEIFNVGSDSMNYQINDVGDIVAREVPGTKVERVGEIDDPRNYRVTFGKIREALGFEPEYDLESGIQEMAAAIQNDPELRAYNAQIFSNYKVMQERFESVGLPIAAP